MQDFQRKQLSSLTLKHVQWLFHNRIKCIKRWQEEGVKIAKARDEMGLSVVCPLNAFIRSSESHLQASHDTKLEWIQTSFQGDFTLKLPDNFCKFYYFFWNSSLKKFVSWLVQGIWWRRNPSQKHRSVLNLVNHLCSRESQNI